MQHGVVLSTCKKRERGCQCVVPTEKNLMASKWKKQRCHTDGSSCESVSGSIPASMGAYLEGMLAEGVVGAAASVGASPEGMLVEMVDEMVDDAAAGLELNKKDLASAHTAREGAACANLLTEYGEIQRQSYAAFLELRLCENNVKLAAEMAAWMLQLAAQHAVKNETAYSGIYLFLTYNAQICRSGSCTQFALHRGRDVMRYRGEEKTTYFAVSRAFKQDATKARHMHLVAACCLCIAAKMEESTTTAMVKPRDMLVHQKRENFPLAVYAVFDFITVERDILHAMQWRLFRVHTPMVFNEMLWHYFGCTVRQKEQAVAVLGVCMASEAYVLVPPSQLSALCLVAVLRQPDVPIDMAKIARMSGLSEQYLCQHSQAIAGSALVGRALLLC